MESVRLLSFIIVVLSTANAQSLGVSTTGAISFSGTYIKSNPAFFGFGLVSGSIAYTPTTMHLSDTLNSGVQEQFYNYGPNGVGTVKFEPNCANYPGSCEITDISSHLLWVLWPNTAYYSGPTADSTFPGCQLYSKLGNSGGTTSLTSSYTTALYWNPTTAKPCGWKLANGEMYNVTSVGSAAPPSPPNSCKPTGPPPTATCFKPMNLVFIVDEGGPTTLADITELTKQLAAVAKSLAISPQIINTFVVPVYGNTNVPVDPSIGTNAAQFTSQINSAFSCSGNSPCRPGGSNIAGAITYGASLVAASTTPYRPNTATTFVLITAGNISSTAAQINAALSSAGTTIGARTSGANSLPLSKVVNMQSILIGNNAPALNVLQTVANTNSQNQLANVRPNPYSSLTNLPSSVDSINNKVFQAADYAGINGQIPNIANNLCATNGLVTQSRSCSGCCGDCKCGAVCLQPDSCPQKPCFSQFLQKAPAAPDSAYCCALAQQCPGMNSTGCNITYCNSTTGVCSYISPSCPTTGYATNCYNRVCDPSTSTIANLVCRSEPKFNATVNSCWQRVCTDAANRIDVIPRIVCPSKPCQTVLCNNNTGQCEYTNIPIPTPAAADQCKNAVCNPATNNSYIWVFPSTCNTSDPCKTRSCTGATCTIADKCNPSDTCTNWTCTAGVCSSTTCPPFGTFPNGTVNRCMKSPGCTAQVGPALSGCTLNPVLCSSSDPCVSSTCVNGACVNTPVCTTNQVVGGVTNYCKVLVRASCGTGSCVYTDVICNNTAQIARDAPGCVNTTCDPTFASGCRYNIPCPNISSNRCGVRNSTCGSGVCTYATIICPGRNLSDPCEDRRCIANTGCPTNYPQICGPVQGSNQCLRRNDSTCALVIGGVQATCNYVQTQCTQTDLCNPNSCQTTTGACVRNASISCANTRVFSNGQFNALCQALNTSACNGQGNCVFTTVRDCTSVYGTCSFNGNNTVCTPICGRRPCFFVSGYNASLPAAQRCQYSPINCSNFSTGVACTHYDCNVNDDTCTILVANCPNSTTNRCNFTNSCQAPCVYQTVTCGQSTNPCNTTSCNQNTGVCQDVETCVKQPCYNRTCGAGGVCTQTQFTCSNPDQCNTTTCDPRFDRCVSTIVCPLQQIVGGQTMRCTTRSRCNPCQYTLNTSCTPRTNCETANCDNSTGGCVYPDISASNTGCPIFNDTNKCFVRDNTTCTLVGRCAYVPVVVCTTPPNYPPCISVTCQNGVCRNFTNTNWPVPVNADPCLTNSFSATSPTCFVTNAKCTPFSNGNKCRPQSCVAGNCVVSQINCPSNRSDIGAACIIAQGSNDPGCDPNTGNCTRYTSVTCSPINTCTLRLCDNTTGQCSITQLTAACQSACQNVNCPPVQNCNFYDCVVNNATGTGSCVNRAVANPTDPKFCIDRPPGDYCTIGQCIPGSSTCVTSYKSITDCYNSPPYKLPPCSRWTLNPNDKNCCSAVGNCNTNVDPLTQCMITSCASDNVTCTLTDNSDTVCPPFQFNDRCLPRVLCDNITGGCVYINKYIECAINQTKIDPCFDGTCDPDPLGGNGSCIARITNRCDQGSLCINSNCTVNKCVQYVCNATNGNCDLQNRTSCNRLDNCTDQVCDDFLGCKQIPFNPTLCNHSDPCTILVLNGSVTGCCSTVPKCPVPPDPICNVSSCTASGQCYYTNLTCDQFEVNGGFVNLCRKFVGCSGGCQYTDVSCPSASNATCLSTICNPQTGTCDTTDLCLSDACTTRKCNNVTSECDVISTTVCPTNNCTNQVCDPTSGCKILFDIKVSTCNRTGCNTTFLNPNKPGCCDYASYCNSRDPCVVATCLANGTCQRASVCSIGKCFTSSCSLDANNQPVCTYVNKTCPTASRCEVADPCVEDNQPFACSITQYCNASVVTDACMQQTCTDNTTGVFCEIVPNPAIKCDDGDSCTTDTCLNGQCVHTYCPSNDPCVVGTCPNGTCVYNPYDCMNNTVNYCLNATCSNNTGKPQCTVRDVVCPTNDYCLIPTCLPSTGCTTVLRRCLLNETCVYSSGSTQTTVTKCGDDACPGKAVETDQTACRGKSRPCDIYECSKGACRYTSRNCPALLSTEAIVGTVSAAVIAGIIVAIVACLACSGGAVYAIAVKNNKDENASVMNNPLYSGTKNEIQNPLHKHH